MKGSGRRRTSASRPARREEVVWRGTAGKGLLLDLKSGAYFELNAAGLAIWKGCDGTTPVERIARGIDRREVRSFLRLLKQRKLLV